MRGVQNDTDPLRYSCHHSERQRKKLMKPLALVGVLLVVLGVMALVYQGITYTSRETVIDIGPLQATADRQKTLPLPPVLGIAAVAGGVMLLVAGKRKHA
jgi:hypothetical protein